MRNLFSLISNELFPDPWVIRDCGSPQMAGLGSTFSAHRQLESARDLSQHRFQCRELTHYPDQFEISNFGEHDICRLPS